MEESSTLPYHLDFYIFNYNTMSNKLTVKYLGKEPTLVRSFGTKVEVKKGQSVEVTEHEYKNLRGCKTHLSY